MSPLQEVHTGFTFAFDGTKFAAIQRGVKRASTNLNTIAQKTEVFTQRVGGALRRIGQLVGAYVGYRAVRALTIDYAVAADAVAKFATATGLSTETYQGLIHAVGIGGTDQENLNKALTQLSKRALEANQGLKTQQRAFGELGVEVTDSTGKLKAADQLFLEMSDGLVNLEDKEKRTGLAMQMLGRTGATLLPTMLEGSKGIKVLIAEAKKLGKVLSKEQLKAAEKFNDEMLRVKAVLEGVRNTIASKVLPIFSKQLEAFRKWWVEGNNAERALRTLKLMAFFTGLVIARIVGASVLRNIKLFVQGIWAGVQALRAMGLAGAVAAIKIWAIIAAFVFVALAIEDLIAFAQGKDSVIGRILGPTSLAKDLKDALIGIGVAAKKAWKDLKPALLDAWKALKPALKELGEAMKPLAGPTFRAGVWLLVDSLKALAAGIEITAGSIKGMTWAFTAGVNGMSKAVDWFTLKWEIASENIDDALEDLKETAKEVAKALGIDLSVAAGMVKMAWDLSLGDIIKGLGKVVNAVRSATALLAALTGQKVGGITGGIETMVKRGRAVPAGAPGVGMPLLPGGIHPAPHLLFMPPPTRALPGFGGAGVGAPQQAIGVEVAAGAIQLRVTAHGDPKQIAKEIATQVTAGINAAFTGASRDLVKAPRGQR